MNILHLQLSGNPGGIVTLCSSVAKASKQVNHMYFLFSGGTVADEMRANGVPVYIADADRLRWRKSKIELGNYCRNNNIDVLICHSNSPIAISHALYIKKKMTSIRLIMYFHGDAKDIVKTTKQKIFHKPLILRMQVKSDAIIAISNFVKDSAIKIFNTPNNKIHVVYNGVDYNRFSSYYSPSKNETVRVIYVGRIFYEKGVHVLVDAVAKISHDLRMEVIIVGRGPSQEELENKVKELGLQDRIKFLGLRMDIPELLSTADYFVHPAIWEEGFGITLIEAMSVGLPCVAFNKGAIPEIIKDNENGFIVDETSSESLANQLEECCRIYGTDKYYQMVENAQATGRSFDISKMVKELESLY